MKTKLEELLKTITAAVESLKEDAAAKDGKGNSLFSPQLGTALGGLRTAQDGLEVHLARMKVAAEPAQAEPANATA